MGRKNKYTKDIKVKAIKEYLAGKKSIGEISNELNCNKSTLQRWIVLYKECGSQIFEDKVHNSNYSKEFKEKVASEYLSGKGSVIDLMRKYKISSHESIRNWILKYKDGMVIDIDLTVDGGYGLLTPVSNVDGWPKLEQSNLADDKYQINSWGFIDIKPDDTKVTFSLTEQTVKEIQTEYEIGIQVSGVIVNDAKVTDHHAIIPTEQYVDLNKLTREERHIYDLVVRRFIAVLSAPFEYDEMQVKVTVGKHNFYTKGQAVKSAGWKALYDSSLSEDDDDGDDISSQSLPPLSQGAPIAVKGVRLCAGKTSPPARYTEATLLTAMENPTGQVDDGSLKDALKTAGGLGTPATRADIIEKLFDSFCIERRGREIMPTSKGRQLIEIVPPDLKSAELTARWEQRLSLIAKGNADDRKFVEEMRGYATSLVTAVRTGEAKYRHDNMTREPCPECGKFLLEDNGKKGKMLVCQDRECGYRKSVSVITNARCPECHKKLEMRGEGDKKAFFCVCGYREKLSDFEKRKESAGAGKRDVAKYMQQQSKQKASSNPLADQLAKWMEENK